MQEKMLTGAPVKTLLFFSLPILAGNLLQQLYSVIDAVIVGHFVSSNALGAIGCTMPIVFMVTCVSFGLSSGSSILIGQTTGANAHSGDNGKIPTLSWTSLIYSLAVALLLALICILTTGAFVRLVDTPADLQADSILYLTIYFCGLPFVFGFTMISSVFRSLGDSMTPLFFLGIASVLNVGLDLFFVLQLKMGVAGAAIATVLSQMFAFFLQIILMIRKMRSYRRGKASIFSFDTLRRLTALALPTTSQEILISLGTLLTQVLTNRFGSAVVSAYTAASKTSDFVMLPMISVGAGMTVFCAQNVGAGQIERVQKAFHSLLRITLGFALITALTVLLFPRQLIALFLGSNITPEIFAAGQSYLYVSAFNFFLMAILFPAECLLKGSGDVNMFMGIAVTGAVVKLAVAVALIPSLGYHGIWLGIAVGWLCESSLTLLRYRSGKWKTKRLKGL